jgi:transcriptional regulator with XRE-family HTH domain
MLTNNMNVRFGDRLKELRSERNWTQKELAARSGIKRGYLASLEAGLVNNPSVPMFLKLASALGVPAEDLYRSAGYVEDSQVSRRLLQTPDDMIDRLRTVQPAAIPLCRWEDFPFRSSDTPLPFDHIYRSRSRAVGRRMEAYVVHGTRYDPVVGENDVIIVDREAPLDEGEMVACRLRGIPTIGRLVKIAGDLFLDNGAERVSFTRCDAPAIIIEVRRWLSNKDRPQPSG